MSFPLDFSDQATEDITYHKKAGNKALLKKMLVLLEEISEHPFTGTGKPEALKHDLAGKWSRRINQEHRLIYEVKDNEIKIVALKGHY
jgi:toxin YoeB